MIKSDAKRLTISHGRRAEVIGACGVMLAIALMTAFGPMIPANPILTWTKIDTVICLGVGGSICLFWIASTQASLLVLEGPANRGTFKISSMLVQTREECLLAEIQEIRIEMTRRSYNDRFWFEVMYLVLRDGRMMRASPRAWRKGGQDEEARACAEFLGKGIKVTRGDRER